MKPLLLDEIRSVLRASVKSGEPRGKVLGVTTDSRRVVDGDLFVALRGERFDGCDFVDDAVGAGARAVIVDRSLPVSEAVRASGACLFEVEDAEKALGEVAHFYRKSLGHSVTVIGVTGSNGKTTTREMIYHVLSKKRRGHQSPANFNNQIGVPLTLLGIKSEHDFAVVEMGSNGPGEIAALSRMAMPDIAVITQVGPASLEGFGDMNGVSLEKSSVVAGLAGRGAVVCGMGHALTLERVRGSGKHVITFGLDESADVWGYGVERGANRLRFMTNDRCEVVMGIGGVHNVSNALAALAVVRRLGVTSREFAEAMADFEGVDKRLKYYEVNGITIIDDTYNANPASMSAALGELMSHPGGGRRVFICGDMGELGAGSERMHKALGEELAAAKVDLLLTVGEKAAMTAVQALEAGMGRGQVQRAVSSKRLARLVKSLIFDGDVIVVKGSRAMTMELVVDSLKRWRGRREVRSVGGVGRKSGSEKFKAR